MSVHEFVAELKKLSIDNFDNLVVKAVAEVKEQLHARAKQGYDRHEITLPSEKIAKGVVTHLLNFEGLKVEFKGRSITVEW